MNVSVNQLTILVVVQMIAICAFIKKERLSSNKNDILLIAILGLLAGAGAYIFAGSAFISQELTMLLILDSITLVAYFEYKKSTCPNHINILLGISVLLSALFFLSGIYIMVLGALIGGIFLLILKFIISHIPGIKFEIRDYWVLFISVGAVLGGNNMLWLAILSIILPIPEIIIFALLGKGELLTYKPIIYFVLSVYVLLLVLSNNWFRLTFTIF